MNPDPRPLDSPITDSAISIWLRWGGLFVAVGAAALRAMTIISPFPAWELDPLVFSSPTAGLGPGGSMLVDSLILFGAGLGLIGEWLGGRPVSLIASTLGALGTVGVVVHARSGLSAQWIGLSWVAAIWLGIAVSHAARDARLRRMLIATICGFVAALAVKGAHQLLIDHPSTVSEFARNRLTVFEAQGWTEDSPMAKAYERRLLQPEATGWFGLANVYASFAAAGVVLLAGLFGASLLARGRARRGGPELNVDPAGPAHRSVTGPLLWIGVLLLALCLAIAAAAMAGSKGGIVAIALGVVLSGVLLIFCLTPVRNRVRDTHALAAAIGPMAILATFVLVIVRGLIGERVHELSLLFRWFYTQAAVRIAAGYPILGVGPDGFQRAYLLAKSPLSPEEVSSPHNVLLEWWATLGLFGLAWCALFVWWSWCMGERATEDHDGSSTIAQDGSFTRNEARWIIGVASAAVVTATWLDKPIMTVDSMLARVGGLILWSVIGWAVLSVMRRTQNLSHRAWRLGLAGAGMAIACHGLIDVTGTWPNSAAMFLLVVATAGAHETPRGAPWGGPRALPRLAPGIACCILGVWTMTLWARPGIKWEQDLERGATVLHPVADIGQEWRELSQASPQSRTDFDGRLREIATQLAHVLGRPIEPVPAAVARALAEMDLILIPRAVNSLESALSRYPDQWKVSREISRLHLRSASLLWSRHQEAGAREQFEKSARAATPQGPNAGIAAAWGALGFVHHTEAEVTGEIRPLSRAALAWEEGAALDPYSLEYPVRLMKAYEDLGRLDEARAWARKVLDVDALQRLDQSVRGLNDSDRGRALRLLEKP